MATRRRVTSNRTIYTRRPTAMRTSEKGRLRKGPGKVGVGVVVGLVAIFSLWRVFAISQVGVSGNTVIPEAEIKAVVNRSFSHHVLSKNLLTLGLASLEDDLLVDQRISSVAIIRHWPNRVSINISERQLSMAWRSGESEYLVDNKGVAVAELSGKMSMLPLVIDTTSLPVKIGDRVAPQSFVSFTNRLVGEIKGRTGVDITSMSVPDTTSELDVKTKQGYLIKFDTTGGVEKQLSSLKTVLDTLIRLQKKPTQYIDLRVPGKAYYL